MRHFPLIPTILVAAAVATMIGLGIWQLGRAEEKDALRAQLERNSRLPLMALPPGAVADQGLLFRRAGAFCLEVVGWRSAGGKARSGRTGTRHIAECRTGAEGPGFLADLGVSADPKAKPAWRGGEVAGPILPEPGQGGLLDRIFGDRPPPRPMIVSERGAPGLEPTAPPGPDSFTNNSRSYAFQWFFFALAAAAIYLLALRGRRREDLPPAA
jgi:surfeit locus 1 family protein